MAEQERPAADAASQPRLSPDRLFSDPPLFGGLPQQAQFTPDGRAVAFLRAAADVRERLDLWRYDLERGLAEPWITGDQLDRQDHPESAAEAAERERKRKEEEENEKFRKAALAKQTEARPGMVWNPSTREYQALNTDESWRD